MLVPSSVEESNSMRRTATRRNAVIDALFASRGADAVAGLSFALAMLVFGVGFVFRDDQVFDSASCSPPGDNPSVIQTSILVAGFCGGCLLLLLATMLGNPVSQFPLRVAALAFATSTVFFTTIASNTSPFVCVRVLGGLSDARPQRVFQIVFWTLTDVPITWALSVLAHQPVTTLRRLAIALFVLFSSGAICMFSEVFPLWIVSLVLCCTATVYVSGQLVRVILAAHAQSKDSFTRGLTIVALPILNVVWYAFPVLWLLGQLSVISPAAEDVSWVVLCFLSKFTLVVTLMFGVYFEHKQGILKVVEDLVVQQKEADIRYKAKRIFISEILDEVRAPLRDVERSLQALLLLERSCVQTNTLCNPSHSSVDNAVDDASHAIRAAELRARGVGRMLDDVLAVASIEDYDLSLEPVDFALERWLRDVLASFGPSLLRKELRLELDLDPGLPAIVHADNSRLQQILATFLWSAIKRSFSGTTIYVRVRCETRSPASRLTASGEALCPETGSQPTRRVQRTSWRPDPYIREDFTSSALFLLIMISNSNLDSCGQEGLHADLEGLFCSAALEAMGGTGGSAFTPSRGAVKWFDIPIAPSLRNSAATPGSRHQPSPETSETRFFRTRVGRNAIPHSETDFLLDEESQRSCAERLTEPARDDRDASFHDVVPVSVDVEVASSVYLELSDGLGVANPATSPATTMSVDQRPASHSSARTVTAVVDVASLSASDAGEPRIQLGDNVVVNVSSDARREPSNLRPENEGGRHASGAPMRSSDFPVPEEKEEDGTSTRRSHGSNVTPPSASDQYSGDPRPFDNSSTDDAVRSHMLVAFGSRNTDASLSRRVIPSPISSDGIPTSSPTPWS